ncbi:hypothetical protein COCCADRAFT_39343 [Bipolaris zeicola 26-R-13]|uniref:Uncharacterized protein n=1 Tax=Cochliobolus carbonum (strain 26-R-13) TaxID=930089 RepID=W6XSA6_COCC2|nr:uncharacterized protein COCCADRAFT_39343 [Bipolaris zeicola 26-R-13]EUC30432.1 hypothetical protein COCCADRAFT_39343 [Bipolaris zeicola 26-R-13]
MSHQTQKTNFIPLLPVEIHSQTKKVSPPINKITQQGCEPRTEITPSSQHQDRNQTSPSLSHGVVDQGKYDYLFLKANVLFSQSSEHTTETMPKEKASGITTEVNELLKTSSWSIPHAHEYQKHAWHSSVLGMEAKVKDEWGFSSANASRSHTPNPIC